MRHNRAHGSWRTIRHTKQLLAYLVVVLFMFMVYFPFYWIVCTSLKDFHALYDQEHLFWPEKISFENYHLLLTKTRFLDWMINSVIVSVSSTCISIVAGCLGAYALVRLKFRGQDFISSSILITYLVPPSILFIPLYYTLKQFHLANNLMGLIVAYPTFAIPFCTWLLMGFFKTIPVELDDAALIDGCTRFQAFYRIVLPLTGPGIVAVALFAWTFAWKRVPLCPGFHKQRAA